MDELNADNSPSFTQRPWQLGFVLAVFLLLIFTDVKSFAAFGY